MATNDLHAVPRFLSVNAVMGFAIGAVFGIGMLATNTGGAWSLVSASSDACSATIAFLAGWVMTVTPLVIATAIGLLERQ